MIYVENQCAALDWLFAVILSWYFSLVIYILKLATYSSPTLALQLQTQFLKD